MTTKSILYRFLSFSNDVNAIRRGPKAVVKRQARKSIYKGVTRLMRRGGL
jgi:hypothetical protein